MKKKLLALLLALVLVAGLLAGCQDLAKFGIGVKEKPVDSVVGDWTAELDFTDAFKDYFQSNMDESMGEMGDYVDLDKIFDLSKLDAVVTLGISFREDGTATSSISSERMVQSMGQVVEDMKDNLIEALPDIMEAAFAQEGMTMAEAEEQLAQVGLSMDDLMDEMEQELESSFDAEISSQLDELNIDEEGSGYYVVDGNKIYLLNNEDDDLSESGYMEYEFQGSTMVVTDMSPDVKEAFSEMEEMGVSVLPMVFRQA